MNVSATRLLAIAEHVCLDSDCGWHQRWLHKAPDMSPVMAFGSPGTAMDHAIATGHTVETERKTVSRIGPTPVPEPDPAPAAEEVPV